MNKKVKKKAFLINFQFTAFPNGLNLRPVQFTKALVQFIESFGGICRKILQYFVQNQHAVSPTLK